MKAVRTFFLLVCFCVSIPALSQTVKTVVLFESGKSNISAEYQRQLRDFATGLKDQKDYLVEIGGHTDNTGNKELNQELSEERAKAVHEFLVNAGADRLAFSVEAYGAERPVGDNATEEGKRMNRRVEVTVILNSEEISTTITEDISDLYRQLEIPMQEFCIDPLRDTSLRCKDGTVIHIKANTLNATGCGNHCVKFRVKEVFRRSDMIRENLSTTSNGRMLISQAMIYTEAIDCNGNPLQALKDLVIVVQTDTINAENKMFRGARDHDSVMNWITDEESRLSDFTMQDVNDCGSMLCGRGDDPLCESCPFFFCRIGRIGKSLKGIFNKETREANREYRACLAAQRERKFQPVVPPPIPRGKEPLCSRLADLFKRYNVTDVEGVLMAINKPVMDSLRVTTIHQLRDTLNKIRTRKIELAYVDGRISYDDMKFYIFNQRQLGWINIDCFSDFPSWRLVDISVDLAPADNVDCKLIFTARRSVLPGRKDAGRFAFDQVPRDERAILFALKLSDGKPHLSMETIEIAGKTFTVEFRELTLEELKQELKKLDQ